MGQQEWFYLSQNGGKQHATFNIINSKNPIIYAYN